MTRYYQNHSHTWQSCLVSSRSLTAILSIIKSLSGLQHCKIRISARPNVKSGRLGNQIKMAALFHHLKRWWTLTPLLHLKEPEDPNKESLKNWPSVICCCRSLRWIKISSTWKMLLISVLNRWIQPKFQHTKHLNDSIWLVLSSTWRTQILV